MPRIPNPQSDVDLSGTLPQRDFSTARADPGMFNDNQAGASNAAGVENAANSGFGLASAINSTDQTIQDRVAKSNVANNIATHDFSKTRFQLQAASPPGDPTMPDKTKNAYIESVDQHVQDLPPAERQVARDHLMQHLPNEVETANKWQRDTADADNKLQSSNALDALYTRGRIEPGTYPALQQQGMQVIDTANVPESAKPLMKTEFNARLADQRFQSLITAAKTPEELDGIKADLIDPKNGWLEKFDVNRFNSTIDQIGTAKISAQNKLTSAANAALGTLEERVGKGPIDPQEMKAVGQLVEKSGDPNAQARWAKAQTQQDVYEKEGRGQLPSSVLRQRITATSGEPGQLFANVPPEVVTGANSASQMTNGRVSASYLVGNSVQEYGKFYKMQRGNADEKFAPTGGEGIGAQMTSAATVAGQQFGQPLILVPGPPKDGKTIAVSTAGMDEPTKAKLVGSLVQAGYTGFRQNDNNIVADVRDKIPASFDTNFTGFGRVSPEIWGELKRRGFAAGVGAAGVDRNAPDGSPAPAANKWSVDYGQGPTTSSAIGPQQFIEKTWMGLVSDPATRQQMGIRDGLNKDQLLALRTNPEIAMKGAAILAMQNKAMIEPVIGRDMTDGELRLAHVLGGGGALAVMRTMDSNPGASAAALLPDAAEANHNLFYKDGKPVSALQLYSNVVNSINASPSRAAFIRNEARKTYADQQDSAVKTDPMTYASKSGGFVIPQLSDDTNSWSARATAARNVASFYQVPKDNMLPFTADEAQQLKKTMDDGGADTKVNVMTKLSAMGDLATSGAKQLGEKDPVFGYAAGLALSQGNPTVATDIFKGQQLVKDNKAVADSDAMDNGQFKTELNKYLPAMVGMKSDVSNAAIEAAKALYAQRYAGANPSKFSATDFGNAMHAVLGADKGAQAIDTVNGQKTVLPPGVSGSEFDNMLSRLKPSDLMSLSVDGQPPRTLDGAAVPPQTISNEGKFIAIGGGQYNVKLADDRLLMSGSAGGRVNKYTMTIDTPTVKSILARPALHAERQPGSIIGEPF